MHKDLVKRWLMFSIGGLVLIGAGLCLFGEALLAKLAQKDFWYWFIYGTLALIVFNAGVSLFGKGVTYRVQLDRHKAQR